MINQIQEDTGAEITIEDDGTIYIGAADGPSAEAARTRSTRSPTRPCRRSASATWARSSRPPPSARSSRCCPGKDGLLHISQIRKLAGGKRVENVEDVLEVGAKVQVEIAEIDSRGKLSLVPVIEGEEAAEDDATRTRATGSRRRAEPRRVARERPRAAHRSGGGGDGGDRNPDVLQRAGARHERCIPAPTASGRCAAPSCPAACASSPRPCPPSAPPTFGIWAHVGSRDETPRAERRHALPGAPALQGHHAAHRAGHLLRDRRGRRRDERLHGEGVHLLLRAGARHRPAAGHRRRLRHAHRLADPRARTSTPSAA